MSVRYANRVKELLGFFFIGGGVLMLFFPLVNPHAGLMDYAKYGFLNGFAFTVFGFGNGILTEQIDKILPWTGNIVLRLIVSFIATIVYTSIAWVFVLWIWIWLDDSKMLAFSELWAVLPKNKYAFYTTLLITFFVSLFLHGRGFLIEWKKMAIEAERLKKDTLPPNMKPSKIK